MQDPSGKTQKQIDCELEDVDDDDDAAPPPPPLGSGGHERTSSRAWSRAYPDYYAFYETPAPLAVQSNDSIRSMTAPLLLNPPRMSADVAPPGDAYHELEDLPRSSAMEHDKANGKTKSSKHKAFLLETSYFRDNRRKIDFALAFEDNNEQTATAIRRRHRRRVFEINLQEEGLELELEDKMNSQDGKTYFLKIHAPWEVLTRYAELMNLKMPIKESDGKEDVRLLTSPFDTLPCKFNTSFFDYDHDLVPDEPYYYTCAFNRERAKQFLIKSKDSFFSNAQRSRIVYESLMRTQYDRDDPDKFGILRMLNNGSYQAAFSLHEGSYSKSAIKANCEINNRRILFQEWAQIRCFYKVQPLPLIRKYFGEKIGIYFAWLGFYTYMLVPPAIVGLLCFFYGLLSLAGDIPTRDICDENGLGSKLMCPICDKCPCERLVQSCDIAKVTYLFDNDATIFFSIFMSFWSTLFLEFWKRQQSRIAWEWDSVNVEDEEEGLNKLQEAQDNNVENQATNDGDVRESSCSRMQTTTPFKEPESICNRERLSRIAATGSCIVFMLLVALGAVLGVITYRIVIVSKLLRTNSRFLQNNADWISSISASLINFVLIVILDKVYYRIAKWLTNLEQPRTQTEYEDSFTFKMYLFQFINFYSSLIYIAFCKGRIRTEDKSPIAVDQCDPTGCMFELVVQLTIIMVGKQILNNVNEILTPVILNWWRSQRSKMRTHDVRKNLYTRWEQDYDLASMDRMALFDEYIEMVIQYGFVTLFVAAFPLAPLFALLNNIVEIRLDAYKFVTQLRRPIAAKAQDIGMWLGILKGISILSVITNAFIIAYTSDFIPRMVYLYYYSKDGTYAGYINSTLSQYNGSDSEVTKNKVDQCWYVDHRSPPDDPTTKYSLTLEYWHVFAARLAFIVVYETRELLQVWAAESVEKLTALKHIKADFRFQARKQNPP